LLFLFLQGLNQYKMGRGDKKTKKGKIFKGSFGKARPAKTRNSQKTQAKTA
jgi:30S ribosomal protein S31